MHHRRGDGLAMGYYIHKGNYPLGHAPLDAGDAFIVYDLKTLQQVLQRVQQKWGNVPCRIYTFDDIYDKDTFVLLLEVE